MKVVEVRVIIREDRHIGKSRVIKCFPKQSAVMGQAAVTDVLSGGNGNFFSVIFSALQSGKCLADDDLSREADVVMDILLSETDRLVTADRQRLRAESLLSHGCRHDAAEGMGGVRNQDDALFPVTLFVFYRVRIGEGVNLHVLMFLPLHADRFNKGADTDPQRSLDLTLVEL